MGQGCSDQIGVPVQSDFTSLRRNMRSRFKSIEEGINIKQASEIVLKTSL